MLVAHFACNQAQHTEEVFDVVPADDKASKVMLEGESSGAAGRAFGTDEYWLLKCLRVGNILPSKVGRPDYSIPLRTARLLSASRSWQSMPPTTACQRAGSDEK